MQKITKSILVLSIILLSTSCLNLLDSKKKEELTLDKDFKLVKINNEYSMQLPKYMKEDRDLNPEASLQYQNPIKDVYTIVIDESKENFIEMFKELEEYNNGISVAKNYRDIQFQILAESMEVVSEPNPENLEINGMDSEMGILTGKVDGVLFDVAYHLTFIEGVEKVYMIMSWTRDSKMDKYRATFEQTAKSFELL